jgi:plasmid stabilization system protein ParE
MNVIWTETSELTLVEIINYIEIKFGILISEKYYSDVITTVEDIKNNPELFPIYQIQTATRKAVINKKTILYYQIEDTNINLLAFYDVRKGVHKL